MRLNIWSGEFRKEKLLFNHARPEIFTMPQCRRHLRIYMVYRLVCVFFFATAWLYDSSEFPRFRPVYLVAATTWAYVAILLSALLELSCALHFWLKIRRSDLLGVKHMSRLFKASWFLFNTSIDIAPLITIVYWGFVHDPAEDKTGMYTLVLTHVINTVYVFVNFWATGHPVQVLHFWHALVTAAAYLIFHAIYSLAGGRIYKYDFLDWKNEPLQAIGVFFGVVVAIIFSHLVWFVLYKIKIFMYASVGCICNQPLGNASTTNTVSGTSCNKLTAVGDTSCNRLTAYGDTSYRRPNLATFGGISCNSTQLTTVGGNTCNDTQWTKMGGTTCNSTQITTVGDYSCSNRLADFRGLNIFNNGLPTMSVTELAGQKYTGGRNDRPIIVYSHEPPPPGLQRALQGRGVLSHSLQ